MRVAILSDAHGNAFALEPILSQIRSEAPDLILNLGDQVYGRADPARACQLQAELEAVEVLGNTEMLLTKGDALGGWLLEQLPVQAVVHLQNLPITATALEGKILACHGNLTDPNACLLWEWERGPFRAKGTAELRQNLEGVVAEVVLCGHTHREMATRLDDTLLINVGAVSNQFDGDPRARWTLLERKKQGWSVDFRRVEYDTKGAAAWAKKYTPNPEEDMDIYLTGL